MRTLTLLVMLLAAACTDAGPQAQREIAIPDFMLGYTYSGGTIKPIPNTQTGIVNGSSLQSAY